jgi:hypothetical protein
MKKTPGRTGDLSPSPTPPEVSDAFLSFLSAVVAFNPGVPERGAAPAPQADRQQGPRAHRWATSADDAGYLKNAETFAQLGADFKVGTTTAWRYVNEAVKLLSARSPKLGKALRRASRDGLVYLVLDGTLIPIDRVKADRPFYSGKHKKHGMNLQVIAGPDGIIA